MSQYFPAANEFSEHRPFSGVTLRTCGCQHMMLSMATLEAGAHVRRHDHPHEQVGIILEGQARFKIGDEEKLLGPGDLFLIPGNVSHEVTVLDQPTRILDIFHPVREDYR